MYYSLYERPFSKSNSETTYTDRKKAHDIIQYNPSMLTIKDKWSISVARK
jgi:hypothetical protein